MLRIRPPALAAAAARWARKAAIVSAGAALALGGIPALAAHADGKITWKNYWTGKYLEVYRSSLDDGARVGQYKWNGGDNQYWYDVKLSDGYYLEYNNNSWLLLTAYNSCGDGVTQWEDGSWSTQEWREIHVDSDHGWMLINKAGCSGNAYNDVLTVNGGYEEGGASGSPYDVRLYNESSGACNRTLVPASYPLSECFWK